MILPLSLYLLLNLLFIIKRGEKKKIDSQVVVGPDSIPSSFQFQEEWSGLQLEERKRRFSKAIRAGIYGVKQLQHQHKRHWISPISKLKELNHNPFLTKQRLQKRVSIHIQPQNLTELAKAILVELIRDEEAQVLLGRMDFPRLVFYLVWCPHPPIH